MKEMNINNLNMSDYISYYTEKWLNSSEEEKHDLYEELVDYTTGKCKELLGKTDEDIEENHGLFFAEDLLKLEDRELAANYLALANLISITTQINKPFDEIQPIPLTPEILEKNGWEKRPTGYVFYTDGKRYDNSLWYIFGSNTFVVNTVEFKIKYVHELQYVLKLLNIDKEIEL